MARGKAQTESGPAKQTKNVKSKKRLNEESPETLSKKLKAKNDEAYIKANVRCIGGQKKLGKTSILHYIYQSSLGQSIHAQLRQCLQEPFIRSLGAYRLHRTASPFDRRVTCLEWHPTHPTTVAVGSKGGDIILWDYDAQNKRTFIQGMGAGDAITGMKFNQFNTNQLFTSSIWGATTLRDFNGSVIQVFAETNSWV